LHYYYTIKKKFNVVSNNVTTSKVVKIRKREASYSLSYKLDSNNVSALKEVLKFCPKHFLYSPTAKLCYKIVLNSRSWNESSLFCKNLHPFSKLVVIRNVEEQNVLKEALKSLSLADLSTCYNDEEKDWQFLSGGQRKIPNECSSPFVWRPSPDYPETEIVNVTWKSKNPSCHSSLRQQEDCVSISYTENGRLNDIPCWGKYCSICQIHIGV